MIHACVFMCAGPLPACSMAKSVLGMQKNGLESVLQVVPTMLSQLQLAHGQKHSNAVVPAGIYRQALLRMLVSSAP